MYERQLLGLREAQEAIRVMLREVENRKDYYWQFGVFAVVDFTGSLIAFARMDGAHQQGTMLALRKAYTAALWGKSISQFRELVKPPLDLLSMGADFTLSKGGVAIVKPSAASKFQKSPYCLGAIGVAGCGLGEVDEEVAHIGARYIESVLWPNEQPGKQEE
ncbi:MAG: heme-binding protein [Chloroflexi bacterium]|nr:heme-binding protein [Chloroflexota bacterium]